MQDVNKNNQEVRELANAQKSAELDTELAALREQISRVAKNTSVQSNNSASSDVSREQTVQSGNNAVSEPCTSNSSCLKV